MTGYWCWCVLAVSVLLRTLVFAEESHLDSVNHTPSTTETPPTLRLTNKGRVVVVKNKESQRLLLLRQEMLCLLNSSSSSAARPADAGHEAGVKFCPRVWDGLQCWPETPAGHLAIMPCPHYIDNFIIDANASRECMDDASWQVIQENNSTRTWSNYSACANNDAPAPRPSIVHPIFMTHMRYMRVIYLVGYSISLIALTVAVIIMLYIKKLHCPRNTLHVNLFFSFILRCVMALTRDALMSDSVGLRDDTVDYADGFFFTSTTSLWKCRVIMILFNYATTANYSWIFIEGLYLHMLLFVSVFSENSGVRWYIACGWIGPLVCITAWIIAKAVVADPLCWNTYLTGPGVIWVITAPVLITIVINFIFFVNIIYSLFNKLKAFNTPDSYKRLAKSGLVLIPLFGVPYMLFLGAQYHYIDGRLELVKLYFEMTFNSFNGFLVSLLYCFLNGEVQMEVRKKWQHYNLSRFPGFGSRPLVSTYAAVPVNDGGGHTQRQHGQLTPAPRAHKVVDVQHGQMNTHDSNAPASSTRRTLQPTNTTLGHDVIDDTLTSWVPDDARHGNHGYGDVSEGDDDAQQDGADAVRMTRVDHVTSRDLSRDL